MKNPLINPRQSDASEIQATAYQRDARAHLWRELATAAVFGMDLSWSLYWVVILIRPGIPPLAVLGVLGFLLIGSHFLARLLITLNLRLVFRRILYGICFIVIFILTAKILFFGSLPTPVIQIAASPILDIIQATGRLNETWYLLIMLFFAWRGISLARNLVDPFDVFNTFQAGLFMILLYGLGNTILTWSPPGGLFLVLYGFLFCTLVAMASSRIANLSDYRGGRLPVFGSRWTTGLAVAALVVVGVSILFAWILNGQVGQIIARIYLILFAVVSAIFVVILSPLLMLIIEILPRIINFVINLLEKIAAPMQQFLRNLAGNGNSATTIWLEKVINRTESIYLGLLVVIVVVIVLMNLAWKKRSRKLTTEEESSTTLRLTASGLRDLFRQLTANRLWRAGRWLAAARIRRIYAQLMHLCERLETPRPQAVTPLEFLPALDQLFPAHYRELQTITQAYVRIRYGELPESQQEIEQVLSAWDTIQTTGKRMLRLRPKIK